MIRHLIISGIFFLAAGISAYAEGRFTLPQLDQITLSMLWLGFLYIGFFVILIELIGRRIEDAKSAYRYRKTVRMLFFLVYGLVLFRIWIEDPQALIVSYGIVAAGAAIALQDLIKNLAGGIVVVTNNFIRVGDRIQIEDSLGDVIDIGVFNTTMFEIQNWVDGDQATGRIVTIPNGVFLSKQVMNYTGDHEYIWDEIMIPLTYQSDWKKAEKLFKDIVEKETQIFIDPANTQLRKLSRRYYIAERQTEPVSFVTSNDNWIELTIRYITEAKQRRSIKSEINKAILASIARNKSLSVASTTIDIVGFPGKKKT